jgi:dTDP-4-amino-4,6-dideoxygalactose transaminase
VNSRLDEIQAAILRARLPHLAARTERRRALARIYRDGLPASVAPVTQADPGHVYHLFPVHTPRRTALQAHLAAAGIETLVHYPVPLSAQPAFRSYSPGSCPVAAQACEDLLSLPLHPGLADRDIVQVAEAVRVFEKGQTIP